MDRLDNNNKLICMINNGVVKVVNKLKAELRDSTKTIRDDLKSLENFRTDILAPVDAAIRTLNNSLAIVEDGTPSGTFMYEENNNANVSPAIVKRKRPAASRFDLCLGTTQEETNAGSYENDDWKDTLLRTAADSVEIKQENRTSAVPLFDQHESDVDDVFEETLSNFNKGIGPLVNGASSEKEFEEDNASNHSADTEIYNFDERGLIDMFDSSTRSLSRSSFVFDTTADLLKSLGDDADDTKSSVSKNDSTKVHLPDSPEDVGTKNPPNVVDERSHGDDDRTEPSPSQTKTLIVKLSNLRRESSQVRDNSDDSESDRKNDLGSAADSQLSSDSEPSSERGDAETKSNSRKVETRSEETASFHSRTLSVNLVDCLKDGSQSSQQISSLGTDSTGDVSFLKSMDELLKVCRVEYLQPDYEMQPNLQQLDVAERLLMCLDDVENQRREDKQLQEEIKNWTYSSSDSGSSDEAEFNENRVSLRNIIDGSKRSDSDSSTDSDDIDRLCDLSTLNMRKRHTKSLSKKRKRIYQSDSDSMILSSSPSFSSSQSSSKDSESDIEMIPSRPMTPKLDAVTEAKINEIIMNNICNDTTENDVSASEEDKEEEEEEKKDGRKNDVANEVATVPIKNEDGGVKKLTPKELSKKSWRNDPLLTKAISSDSSDDSVIGPRKIGNRRRISSSESSSTGEKTKPKMNWGFSIELSSDSSGCDSDCEIVRRDETDNVDEGEKEETEKQKGRRNIRALVSDEFLAEATQRANKEEQERIERLEERQKKMSSLSQSFTQSLSQERADPQIASSPEEPVEPLILDLDECGNPLVEVHPKLVKGLKPHQIAGVRFMWDSCYESIDMIKEGGPGSGCILAHCMGLGKTVQVIALIQTLFAHKETNTKHVLVVCPLSTVPNWQKEIDRVFEPIPHEKFNTFAISNTRSNPYNIIRNWSVSKRSVLIVGYDLFRTITSEKNLLKNGENRQQRLMEALIDPGPDLIVCDEGHLLMNKNCRRTLALNKVKTKRRVVLTGTPLQNNLKEYYYMVQFVKPNLLGTLKEYNTNFVNPITNGQYKDSTAGDISLMKKRTHVLHNLLKKTIHRVEDTELKTYLPRIVDYAVFIKLAPFQTEMHKRFMELITSRCDYKNIITNYKTFQYIASHPSILVMNDSLQKKKTKEQDVITADYDNVEDTIDGWWKTMMPEDVRNNIEYGNKMLVLKEIIEESEKIGDKVLVFSQSLAELDLIEHFLTTIGTTSCPSWKKEVDYLRMDGTVLPELRTKICDKFNDTFESKIRLLLMSIKVGGLGLNLTAANRVVIMTVSWNPSYDVQSVFRVYRFGQEKEVYVYRLVAVGTMEEKVYQRTVTKLAIAHRVVDKHQIQRHYKTLDLEDMYSCRPEEITDRPACKLPEDTILGKLILRLSCVYRYHEHQTLLADRPEENLNPSELAAAWEEFKKNQFAPPPPQPGPQLQPGPASQLVPPWIPLIVPGTSGAPDARTRKYKRRKYAYDVVSQVHKRPAGPSTNYNPNGPAPFSSTLDTITALRGRFPMVPYPTSRMCLPPPNEL